MHLQKKVKEEGSLWTIKKEKDPFLGASSMQIDRCLKEWNDADDGLYVHPAWSGSESPCLELQGTSSLQVVCSSLTP